MADNPWVSRSETAVADPAPVRVSSAPPVSGPARPQAGVPEPDAADRLPYQRLTRAASLCWVGAHGGAGVSTLATLVEGTLELSGAWPRPVSPDDAPVPVLLVARSSARGLRAAQAAAVQWASGLVVDVELLGLVVVADAPGRLPRPLRDLRRLVAGGVPRVWQLPWVEEWRRGAPVSLSTAPRAAARLHADVAALLPSPASGRRSPDRRGR